jgi:hypothetical protein
MSTPAQIAANQANAQHSSGPKTGEGKAASSVNNLRHGLAGEFTVLAWERQEEYHALLAGLRSEHNPVSPTETVLVEETAKAIWLGKRALTLQDLALNAEVPMCDEPKQLALYLRYQTTHDRAFHKSLSDLLRLRAEKRKTEIGFESQKRKEADELRKQATEKRKQDVHKWKVLLAEAEAEHQFFANKKLETPEMRRTDRVQRILAIQNAA